MITLNGKRFGAKAGQGDIVGYYKVNRKSITLFDLDGLKIGIINQHKVLCCATKQDDGRFRYSLATIDQVGKWESYAQRRADVENAYKLIDGHETKEVKPGRFEVWQRGQRLPGQIVKKGVFFVAHCQGDYLGVYDNVESAAVAIEAY